MNSQCSDFIVQSLHCAIRSGGRVSGGDGGFRGAGTWEGLAGPDKPAGRGISPGADASTEKEERVGGAVYPGVMVKAGCDELTTLRHRRARGEQEIRNNAVG